MKLDCLFILLVICETSLDLQRHRWTRFNGICFTSTCESKQLI